MDLTNQTQSAILATCQSQVAIRGFQFGDVPGAPQRCILERNRALRCCLWQLVTGERVPSIAPGGKPAPLRATCAAWRRTQITSRPRFEISLASRGREDNPLKELPHGREAYRWREPIHATTWTTGQPRDRFERRKTGWACENSRIQKPASSPDSHELCIPNSRHTPSSHYLCIRGGVPRSSGNARVRHPERL